ncbi:MAG: FKBP-type peptidyl-prolyl cis-trans isomerase [Bacteroidaceae bacterium]|nr:FKBP-type peptidyl-prolyl cis-trans isomerase [Bacteroidaceae bacterium]
MKKAFFTVAATIMAAVAISCSSNESTTGISKGSLNKMDSLSYVYGMSMGHQLAAGIVKELELDFEKLMETMEKTALGKEDIVANDTINEANMPKLYQKVFGRARQMQIQAAKSDSTGNTKLYDSEELRELTSAFVGADAGLGLARMGANIPLQLVWIEKGLKEAFDGTAPMNSTQTQNYIREYFTVKIPAENKKASEAWLAEVEKESGVQKTASGLLYKVTEPGDMSAKPTSLEDVVKVHYKGTTRTGKEFDSSYKRNVPIDFPLNGVIKGWGEGLQLVGKGGKITLWIPAELAYGSRGAGSDIGPNEALRFDVELLDVNPKAE